MSGGIKSKRAGEASGPSKTHAAKKAEGPQRLDRAGLTKSIAHLEQRYKAVEALNAELMLELLKVDPGMLSGTRLGGSSPAQANLLQDTANAFVRKHESAYDALETAAAATAKALATPSLDKELKAGTAAGNALAAEVLHAQQMISQTGSAESALMWAERVLADRESPEGGKLYAAYEAIEANLVGTLRDTVIEPALPQVAGLYFERNGHNAAKAADKLAMQTTFTMAAIRMTALITDAESMTKAASASPAAVGRAGAAYVGASPLLKILRGPGNIYGMYAAVLEIYEGRYINGARHGSTSAAILITHAAGAASTMLSDPTATGWKKHLATKLLNGPTGELVKRGVALAPGVLGAAAGLSFMEHSNRPTSVGNNVSLVGDVTAVAGSASVLAANLTGHATRALALSRFGMVGWYGSALVFGGELYEVGREMRKQSDAISPDDQWEGLKHVLGLKKSVMPGLD